MTDHQDATSKTTTDPEGDAMTDQTTETTDVEAQEPAQPQPDTPETEQETDPRQRSNEAAKYRHRAKEAEAQAAALTEQVAALRTAEVDRVITELGYTPKGFWATGAQLADLQAKTGTIDAAKVRQAVYAAATEYGLHCRHVSMAGTYAKPLEGDTFADAFKPDW